jgi:transposase
MPDERCRILRRRLARREQLTRTRTRAKNEIQAVLARRLQDRPPFADLFGVKGRQWLAGLELPVEERESVDAGLRQIAFMDTEIAAVDRLIAQQALAWPEIRRLMTVSGVNLNCAASFVATARKLTVLFWCMLTRGEDYAHQRPALTKKKTAPARADRRRPRPDQAGRRDLEH